MSLRAADYFFIQLTEVINVAENEYVQIGDEFAVVASTNSGSMAKLHFEVWGLEDLSSSLGNAPVS